MSRIQKAFENKKAFIGFLTGGDPNLAMTEQFIYTMVEAGVDLIEIGIPFSDPVAEGPIIQAADERALAAGCTTDKLFDLVKKVREKVEIPLLFMTYINPIHTYGKDKFMKNCKEAGIDGVIVPDMPFDEKEELQDACDDNGIELVSMIAPTSKERVSMIAKEAQGFLYCVSSLGVTGLRSEFSSGIKDMIAQAKEVTEVPCAIGFGISNPDQAKEMSELADGVIVGSAIVKIIAEHGEEAVEPLREFITSMTSKIRA